MGNWKRLKLFRDSIVVSVTSDTMCVTHRGENTNSSNEVFFSTCDFKTVLSNNNVEILQESDNKKYKLKINKNFTTKNLTALLANRYIFRNLRLIRTTNDTYGTICVLRPPL